MNTQNEQQVIEQVLNQAVKEGVMPNLESAAIVFKAWLTIKQVLEEKGKEK